MSGFVEEFINFDLILYRLSSPDDGYKRVNQADLRKKDIYHFLSPDLKKLPLENYLNLNLDPTVKEGSDYVLVGEKIWNIVKKTYNGGPAVQFFFINEEEGDNGTTVNRPKNFLYQNDYSIYGFPDKHPTYFDTSLEMVDTSGEEPSTIIIPYRLLLSNQMPIKGLLYYVATKLEVDVHQLALSIRVGDKEEASITAENGIMSLREIDIFYENSNVVIKYNGSLGTPFS